jgi:type VI secretion system secreted protein Hcp
MKIDGFLKISDIPGASEREGHAEEIEVHGFDFHMQAPHDPNSLSRQGRVEVGAVLVSKDYDQASPYLKRALFENKKLGEVVFSARRTINNENSDYLVVTLTDASVSSYEVHPAKNRDGVLEEQVGFAYNKIEFAYDKDHKIEMNVRVGK